MNIKPLDDRVLIKQCEADQVTAGGIVLPGAAQEQRQQGTVVAVGPGKLLESGARAEMAVKTGDEVYYARHFGSEIKIDGQEFVILKESDLLAVVVK